MRDCGSCTEHAGATTDRCLPQGAVAPSAAEREAPPAGARQRRTSRQRGPLHRAAAGLLAAVAALTLAGPAAAIPDGADDPDMLRPQGVDAQGLPLQPDGLAGPARGLGRPITRMQILARAAIWADAQVGYSQLKFRKGWRTDCSGYVSMAWELGRNHWTGDLHQVGERVDFADMRPGDMLLYHNRSRPRDGSHVVLFERWVGEPGGDFVMYEQTPPSVKHRTWSESGYNEKRYRSYRYRNVIENEAVWYPVAGDWDGDGRATAGAARPEGETWRWRLSDDPRGATTDADFLYGDVRKLPIVGDWDGDGRWTPGTVDLTGDHHDWYLSNSLRGGEPDVRVGYGDVEKAPVVGDWDGNGTYTPGVVDAEGDVRDWYLANSLTGGDHDVHVGFGDVDKLPVVGDWNGDRVSTPGVVDTGGEHRNWEFTNSLDDPATDTEVSFGEVAQLPVTGDWDGDGFVTPGVADPGAGHEWRLSNALAGGIADTVFAYAGEPAAPGGAAGPAPSPSVVPRPRPDVSPSPGLPGVGLPGSSPPGAVPPGTTPPASPLPGSLPPGAIVPAGPVPGSAPAPTASGPSATPAAPGGVAGSVPGASPEPSASPAAELAPPPGGPLLDQPTVLH
ncbi:hypothetical protein [Catellatospora coxensis]|uniref:Cell wall-associated NlpC family hydrolase n=1 Tax=Catellatospora coxensis TaxID=310354 RepID=A0A8J3LEJ9_9ACTN|nr:hypothetical protein [Catellatospora coxensis]GIG11265.1 hypothetical protein Cco03nite_79650 [Catellatospora coxensis]